MQHVVTLTPGKSIEADPVAITMCFALIRSVLTPVSGCLMEMEFWSTSVPVPLIQST